MVWVAASRALDVRAWIGTVHLRFWQGERKGSKDGWTPIIKKHANTVVQLPYRDQIAVIPVALLLLCRTSRGRNSDIM
jgi:hypothetical protein